MTRSQHIRFEQPRRYKELMMEGIRWRDSRPGCWVGSKEHRRQARLHGLSFAKYNKQILRRSVSLFLRGFGHKRIGPMVGLSYMTVRRYLREFAVLGPEYRGTRNASRRRRGYLPG